MGIKKTSDYDKRTTNLKCVLEIVARFNALAEYLPAVFTKADYIKAHKDTFGYDIPKSTMDAVMKNLAETGRVKILNKVGNTQQFEVWPLSQGSILEQRYKDIEERLTNILDRVDGIGKLVETSGRKVDALVNQVIETTGR